MRTRDSPYCWYRVRGVAAFGARQYDGTMKERLRPIAAGAFCAFLAFMLAAPPARAIVPETFPQGMVSLNFDDGFEVTYDHATSLLRKYGFKATFYIVTNYYKNQHASMVTGAQVLRLQRFGHEVGSHSRSHPLLRKVTKNGLKSEVLGSKKDLEKLGIKDAATFAYPYGDYKKRVRTAVVDAGYIGARTSNGGVNTPRSDRFLLKVKNVFRKTSLASIRASVDSAMRKKQWIILTFHDIQEKPRKYGTTPKNLEAILAYLKAKHVKVVMNSEGLRIINEIREAN